MNVSETSHNHRLLQAFVTTRTRTTTCGINFWSKCCESNEHTIFVRWVIDYHRLQTRWLASVKYRAIFKVLSLRLNRGFYIELEVLREHRPPPNASIIDCWMIFAMQIIAMQLWSESTLFDSPVNPDFGLRTPPGSRRWSELSLKFNHLIPGPISLYTSPRNFVKIRSQLFQLSDGQTNRPK